MRRKSMSAGQGVLKLDAPALALCINPMKEALDSSR